MMDHYANFIEREFSKRKQKNPVYSMRAFARQLGHSHQSLSAVLNHKQGLSLSAAKKMVPELHLTEVEEKLFLALVEQKHHRSKKERERASVQVEQLKKELVYKYYEPEVFSVISDWEHSAILTLTNLSDFSEEPSYLSQKLGITEARAKECFERLVTMGFLRRNDKTGKWQQDNPGQVFNSKDLSKAHQKYYLQLMEIARKKLQVAPRSQREFSNVFFSLTKDDYDFVVEKVTRFRRELMAEVSQRGGESDRIYSLSLQFFPISVPEGEE